MAESEDSRLGEQGSELAGEVPRSQLSSLQHHVSEARVKREPVHGPALRGNPEGVVEGSKLSEQETCLPHIEDDQPRLWHRLCSLQMQPVPLRSGKQKDG